MPQEQQSLQNVQNVAYAATITPNPDQGEIVIVGALTGNITVANPGVKDAGKKLFFEFVQDGTGGRTVTWGSDFKVNWTPTTTAGLRNIIQFISDGTSWIEMFSAVGLPA